MPKSRSGFAPHLHISAFTLLEVLVVILIIGIIINYAVISINVNNPSDILKTEARRLASLLEITSEEALLRSELLGIAIERDAYEFYYFAESDWNLLEDSIFRSHSLPEEIHIEFLSEQGLEASQSDETQPDIICFTSGEQTPFEIKIFSDLTEDTYEIRGDETGNLTFEHDTPN